MDGLRLCDRECVQMEICELAIFFIIFVGAYSNVNGNFMSRECALNLMSSTTEFMTVEQMCACCVVEINKNVQK